jgi:hypothetical protein
LLKYDLNVTPTVDKLVENKSHMQGIYKIMKKWAFKGTLIDFLCFLSLVNYVQVARIVANMPDSKGKSVEKILVEFLTQFKGEQGLTLAIRLAGSNPKIMFEALSWRGSGMSDEEAERVTKHYAGLFLEATMESVFTKKDE